MLQDATLIGYALIGTLIGSLVGLVPGLHVFNIAGVALLLYTRDALLISNTALAFIMLGLVIGWSVVNVIPSIFLFAPDDASAFMVLPATKMLLRGQGAEAALLVGAGTVAGLLALVALSPFLEDVLRPIRAIIQPHIGWMLVTIIAFLVLGEWPRTDNRAPTPLGRLAAAWANLGAALLTFTLSGLMGFVLMYRSPVPLESSYQNLLPAFVGLFTIPGLLQVFAFGQPIPPQTQPDTQTTLQALTPYQLLRGTLTGISGGLFASVLPVVSGGIGGLLAGHATSR
jgi:putative membrane protein